MLNKSRVTCPSCFSKSIEEFYHQNGLPVVNNIIYETREEAINSKKGNISLTFCRNCGLVFNSKYNKKILEYNENYNNDQYFSKYYNSYIDDLTRIFVDKFRIYNKRILEIGSGNGEFLRFFCKISNSKGIGIDPTYQGEKNEESVTFIKDYFNERYFNIEADVVILRHVLEHIEKPMDFISSILHNVNFERELIIIIEIPDFKWILNHGAYWDIAYEHCNYFTIESLKKILELNQIHVFDIFNTFSDQYIVAAGKFYGKNTSGIKSIEEPEIHDRSIFNNNIVDDFAGLIKNKKKEINSIINKITGPFTVWGAAGKGVTFINMLDTKNQKRIPFVIDINKAKQGKYLPITGHMIVPPEILKLETSLKDIIIMNSNYQEEISRQLEAYDRKFNLLSI